MIVDGSLRPARIVRDHGGTRECGRLSYESATERR